MGVSVYTKKTQEYENSAYVTVTADFRKYPSVERSIADHSAYLLGAKNGSKLRYEGVRKGVPIIRKRCSLSGMEAMPPRRIMWRNSVPSLSGGI